ncbi:MAG: hypothetical protein WBI63_03165 [Coriobacteriia bacterium]
MRKGVIYALIVWLCVLAGLAYRGDFWLFAFYLVALGNALSFHWWYACSRCSNVCCGFNRYSPHFFLRPGKSRARCQEPTRFSNVRSLVAGIPVLLSVAVGVVGAAMYSLVAAAVWLVGMVGLGYWYWKVSCVGCGNDCPANRNAAYLQWRQASGKDPASDR